MALYKCISQWDGFYNGILQTGEEHLKMLKYLKIKIKCLKIKYLNIKKTKQNI